MLSCRRVARDHFGRAINATLPSSLERSWHANLFLCARYSIERHGAQIDDLKAAELLAG
jgi:hypothetical protein